MTDLLAQNPGRSATKREGSLGVRGRKSQDVYGPLAA